LEVVDWAAVVAVFVRMIWAAGMGLLEGSVMVPARRAVKVWAERVRARTGRSFHIFSSYRRK
jgi:hypothetical protein